MQRTMVDLPQPDGPMIAVTSLALKVMSIPLTDVLPAVVRVQGLHVDGGPGGAARRRAVRTRAASVRSEEALSPVDIRGLRLLGRALGLHHFTRLLREIALRGKVEDQDHCHKGQSRAPRAVDDDGARRGQSL